MHKLLFVLHLIEYGVLESNKKLHKPMYTINLERCVF